MVLRGEREKYFPVRGPMTLVKRSETAVRRDPRADTANARGVLRLVPPSESTRGTYWPPIRAQGEILAFTLGSGRVQKRQVNACHVVCVVTGRGKAAHDAVLCSRKSFQLRSYARS